MESIILMDTEFNQLAEIASYQSLAVSRSFWGVGTLSLTAHPRTPGAQAIRPGALLLLASQPQHVWIIEDVTETGDRLTAAGVQLKGVAKWRICVPPIALPTQLWQYSGGQWQEITAPETIAQALNDEAVYQGFERPAGPFEGMLWLDMIWLGATVDQGEMTQDLGTAQQRAKYQNFGWDRFTGHAEDAYLHYAMNNLIAPEDPKRALPGLEAEPSQGRGPALPWQARFDKLVDLFADIGEATGLGWDIQPDYKTKRWRFRVLEGADRGAGQPYAAIVSEQMGNATAVTRKRRQSGMATTVYVGGAGEDENRLIISVGGSAEGLNRRELWAEAGSVEDMDMIRLCGENKLTATAPTDTLDADVIDTGGCRYGRDFTLGDIVAVAGGNAQMEARITEVTETYESAGRSVKLIFGDAPVTVGGALVRWNRGATR